jgi:hypothetical protein
MAGGDAVSAARGFARQHLDSLSRDLLHWKSRGVLPRECRFHQLAELVARYSSEEDVSRVTGAPMIFSDRVREVQA